MNFLRNKSLKQWGTYLVVLMALVYAAQYAIIQRKINLLDEAERKIDFTRNTQLANQHLSAQLSAHLSGNKINAPDIAFSIEQQDRFLKTLSRGGRIEDTDTFIEPLSKLSQITFQGLQEDWERYKVLSLTIMTQDEALVLPPTVAPAADSVDSLSLSSSIPLFNKDKAAYLKARTQHEGLWLTLSSWYDKLLVDLEDELESKRNAITLWLTCLIIFDVMLWLGAFYLFNRFILKPLHTLRNNITQHQYAQGFTNNEIGKVAGNINGTIENLKDATDFVTAIGEGNLSINYKELDVNYNPGNNKLADSLIGMQLRLRQLNEEERKRQWSNEGLTKFVDILRSSHDNLHMLGDKIIAALVQYTKSNQGGLYILNDENEQQKYLELISLFAFDIKKHEQRKIKLGEGILGQTFLEKETTALTNFPEEYIRITSGLGDAPPGSILIVPLKVDKEVYGLVELASFHEYEAHEIAFVEKLGESIASTLASVRGQQKNRYLIEQFQQQNEQMRAQEEEMRQNMEEIQATQEEVVRKETTYLSRIKELEEQLGSQVSQEQLNKAQLEALQDGATKKEQAYLSVIQELEKKLSSAVLQNDDWKVVEDLERTMRVNLEALRITEETLNRKS